MTDLMSILIALVGTVIGGILLALVYLGNKIDEKKDKDSKDNKDK